MNATMEDNTVIITVLKNALTAPNSTFELFLESFQTGLGTERLLKHVIAVCLDSKAYDQCCMQVHIHCYLINATDSEELSGINQFMSPSYLKLIWRRMDLLKEVLSLGYNFLFTVRHIIISYGSVIHFPCSCPTSIYKYLAMASTENLLTRTTTLTLDSYMSSPPTKL